MMKKETALTGAAAAIIFATGIPVAPATGQDWAGDYMSGPQPVETPFEVQFEAPRIDDLPAPTSVEPVFGPESFSGLGCVEEDGSVSLPANREATAAAATECPEWVRKDLFRDIDYGGGIGVTMCRLTEEYTVRKGKSILGKIAGKIKGLFSGEVEVEAYDETERHRCDYHGCDLDITQSEANWAANN